jgi:hypothetical protein
VAHIAVFAAISLIILLLNRRKGKRKFTDLFGGSKSPQTPDGGENQNSDTTNVTQTVSKQEVKSETAKDIFIAGVQIGEVKAIVLQWFKENHVKILVDNPDYVYGRWGRGILSGYKYFEVTLEAAIGGIKAKTAGYVMYIPPSFLSDPRGYVPPIEFSDSSFTYGGVPRKQGMDAIKRLWKTLESLPSSHHIFTSGDDSTE